MRINVYSQEITPEIETVEKDGFAGIRFILASPEILHNRPGDDDRSAVTFWCAIDGRTMDRFEVANILHSAAIELEQMEPVVPEPNFYHADSPSPECTGANDGTCPKHPGIIDADIKSAYPDLSGIETGASWMMNQNRKHDAGYTAEEMRQADAQFEHGMAAEMTEDMDGEND